MGLFQTILKGGKNIYSGLVTVGTKAVGTVAKGTDLLLTKKENKAVKKEYYNKVISGTTIKSVKETLPKALTTAGGVTVLGLAAITTAKGVSSKLATGQIGKAALTSIGTVSALSLAGSEKVTTAVGNLPKATAAAAGGIAKAIDSGGQSLAGKTLLGIGAAVVGTGIGLGIGNLLSNKDQLVSEAKGLIDQPIGGNIGGENAILPETTSISQNGVKKTSYKRRRAKKSPSVRQSVRVNIINKPVTTGIRIQNKKYISKRVLYN